MRQTKFHGRYEDTGRVCAHPACEEAGEFRAPGSRGHGFDGPGEWQWLCLDHVREFNAGYDWFEGMSAEEIYQAQAPGSGWRTEQPAYKPTAGCTELARLLAGGVPAGTPFGFITSVKLCRAHSF